MHVIFFEKRPLAVFSSGCDFYITIYIPGSDKFGPLSCEFFVVVPSSGSLFAATSRYSNWDTYIYFLKKALKRNKNRGYKIYLLFFFYKKMKKKMKYFRTQMEGSTTSKDITESHEFSEKLTTHIVGKRHKRDTTKLITS